MSRALFWPVVLVSILAFSGEQAAPQYMAWMGGRETGWMRSQEMRTPVAIHQAQRDPKEGPPKPIPPAPPSPPGTREKKPGGAAGRSGFTGTMSIRVMSGVPGGQTTGRPSSIEFAIAPLDGEQPVYDKAIFITSDPQGQYEVALPPGRYWIGPKAKARNPTASRPGAMEVPKERVVVQEGDLTQLDLVAVGYAP
jgi:hypothetical protein